MCHVLCDQKADLDTGDIKITKVWERGAVETWKVRSIQQSPPPLPPLLLRSHNRTFSLINLRR